MLLLLVSHAYSAIYMLKPVEERLMPGDTISLGRVARGETIELVVERKSDLPLLWDTIEIDKPPLPSGWTVETDSSDKTLVARITLPRDAAISPQRIGVTLRTNSAEQPAARFSADVVVNENLLTASIENLQQEAVVGSKAEYPLVLNNESIATQLVSVESNLPSYWFQPMTVEVAPGELSTVSLAVYPRTYGNRPFAFTVSSQLNDSSFTFPGQLRVHSTLIGKYQAAAYGFPFFTPSFLPQYLLNALLTLLS